MVRDRVLTFSFYISILTRYVWMFFTWFIFLCNDVHVSNNFDWNVCFDNIISGKWINFVNLFHLNTWNVGEVLNTINAQVKPWFILSLQKVLYNPDHWKQICVGWELHFHSRTATGEGGNAMIFLCRKIAISLEPNLRWTSDQSVNSSLSVVVL